MLAKISRNNLNWTSQLLNLLHSIMHVYNSPYSIMRTPTFHYNRPYEVVEYNGMKKCFKNTGTLRNTGKPMCGKMRDFS